MAKLKKYLDTSVISHLDAPDTPEKMNDCDVVLSWNFKHIVNLRAMTAVEDVNVTKRYKNIRILSPTMLLDGEE